MRLHRLEFAALGPFAGHHVIDFDALAAAGLFLLTGPTGAGKSTVIDAVTFALYGDVAGALADKQRLRSQHATPDVDTYVELTFSTPQACYRVRRSPEYARPKRRGAGLTAQKAAGQLWRLASPTAQGELISTSLQEIGSELAAIIGLTKAQFTQTAILPQGQFAQFLHAKSEERKKLLTQVFDTGLYTRLQEDLAARARQAQRDDDAARLVLSERAGALGRVTGASPGRTEFLRAAAQAGVAPGVEGAATVVTELAEEAARLRVVAETAAVDAATTAAAAAAGEQCAQLQARGRQLTARQTALAAAEPHIAATRQRLARHHAAIPLCQAAQEAAAARTSAADCLAQLQAAERQAGDLLPRPLATGVSAAGGAPEQAPCLTPEQLALAGESLAAALEARAARGAELEAAAKREELLPAQAAQLAADAQRHADLAAQLAERQAERAALPARRADLEAQRETTRRAAAQLASAQAELTAAQAQATALQEHAQASAALAEAEQRATQAEARLTQARVAARAALEDWLATQAAGLAAELEAGRPCPVCGSPEHPAPAVPGATPVTRADVDARNDAAEAALQTQQAAVARVQARQLAVERWAAEAGGVDAVQVADRQAAATQAVAACQQAAARADELTGELQLLADRDEHLGQELTDLAAQQGELAGTLRELRAAHQRDAAEVEAARGAYESVAARLQAQHQEVAALRATQRALDTARQAITRLAAAEQRVAAALAASDFASLADAAAATVADPLLAELEAEVAAHEQAGREVAAALAEPALQAALAEPSPDLEDLRAQAEAAAAAADEARAEQAASAHQLATARAAYRELATALRERARARAQAEALLWVADLATARVTNQAALPLDTFVLLDRFAEVLAAANPRIAAISAGRYELLRTNEEGGQRARLGGLGLSVVDHFAGGQQRNPRTLSGGETFYVSLCLALALADVVRAEAGGIDIQTLFIDEGFGSLDPATLDEVMTQLQALRVGGRTVGVVSHVAELSQRIADRITVHRTPAGSTLTVQAGDGSRDET